MAPTARIYPSPTMLWGMMNDAVPIKECARIEGRYLEACSCAHSRLMPVMLVIVQSSLTAKMVRACCFEYYLWQSASNLVLRHFVESIHEHLQLRARRRDR